MRHSTLSAALPAPELPGPLTMRSAGSAEAGALASLLGRAFPDEHWDTRGTELELFEDNTVLGTMVIATPGRLLATASLQVRPSDPGCGWLRWVATEQDRRREGLAAVLVTQVLALAAESGCREVRLRTASDRLAAIALYLKLNFEPLTTS